MPLAILAALWCGEAARADGVSGIPSSWRSYSSLLSHQLQAWLMADSDVAYRFHKFLQDRPGADASAAMPLKLWIGPDGRVIDVDFPSLGDAQADADLRQLLTDDPVSEPPPSDMPQPVTLRLGLKPRS